MSNVGGINIEPEIRVYLKASNTLPNWPWGMNTKWTAMLPHQRGMSQQQGDGKWCHSKAVCSSEVDHTSFKRAPPKMGTATLSPAPCLRWPCMRWGQRPCTQKSDLVARLPTSAAAQQPWAQDNDPHSRTLTLRARCWPTDPLRCHHATQQGQCTCLLKLALIHIGYSFNLLKYPVFHRKQY